MSRFTEFSLGVTLLIFAVASNTVGADPETAYASSASAKYKAAREVYNEAKEAESNIDLGRRKLRQTSDQELLLRAIGAGDKRTFSQLVEKVDLNDGFRIGEFDFTPLEIAVLEERDDFIPALIRAGADPNRVNAEGLTPLLSAIFGGNSAVVKALLDGGADPELKDALLSAVLEDEPRIVILMINAGADPNRFAPGEEPLLLASILGHPAVVNALLDGGADPSATIEGFNYIDLFCACLSVPNLDEFCSC